MEIFQNSIKKYHSLSINMFSQYYETIDKKYDEVQFSYKGIFDDINLSYINKYIEVAVPSESGIRTNLFKVFVELAQNIAQNSIDKIDSSGLDTGCGIMIINKRENNFEIVAGNPANNNDIEILKNKIEEVNACNESELRHLKREYRKKEQGEKGNANIGLIIIAGISVQKIAYDIIPIDDKSSFFTIIIKL